MTTKFDETTGEIDAMERIPERTWQEAIRTHVAADRALKEPQKLKDAAKKLLLMAHAKAEAKVLFDDETRYESVLTEGTGAATIDVNKVDPNDWRWLWKRGLLRVDVQALERQPDSLPRDRVLALKLPGKPRQATVRVARREA